MDQQRTTRLLLAGGVVGPLLFIVVFLIEGVTRPGYSAWRNFVSSLSLSDQGWEQITNFLICGLLSLGFAFGLRRALRTGKGAAGGPGLLAVFGLGLLAAGVFATDPGLGYPPGAAPVQTAHGIIHGVAGLVVFLAVAAAGFVLARRFASEPQGRSWAVYSILTGLLVVGFFIAAMVASVRDELGDTPNGLTGLFQRIAIVAGWGWISLLALRLLRRADL